MNRRNLKGPGLGLFWVVLVMYGAAVLVLLFGLALVGRAQADEPGSQAQEPMYITHVMRVGDQIICYGMSDSRTVHCYAREHSGVPRQMANRRGQQFILYPGNIKEM